MKPKTISFIYTGALAGFMLIVLALAYIAEAGGKVQVCHFTDSDSNPTVEIAISENALQTHLDHGDVIFDEENGCDSGDDGDDDVPDGPS